MSGWSGLVQVRERVAAARERDDRRTLRLLRGEQLLRLHPPPPLRTGASTSTSRPRATTGSRSSTTRRSSAGRTDTQDVRDPPAQDPARRALAGRASPADAVRHRPGPPRRRRHRRAGWPFPRGDVWLLRYRGTEIDDGSVATGPRAWAGLDAWQNWEPLSGYDVVVWYGAHFSHDIAAEPPGSHGHIVGPDARPVNW